MEATTSDAPGTVADARAGTDADADAGPFCKRAPHDFCADFDQGQPVAFGFESVYVYPKDSGTAVVDFTTFASPPASALVRTFGLFGDRGLILEHTLGDKVTTAAHFSLDLHVEENLTALAISLVFQDAGVASYELSLVARGGSFDLQEHAATDGGTYDPTPLAIGFPLSTWTHVEADILFSATPSSPHAVFRVNGVNALNTSLRPYAHPGTLVLQAGTVFTGHPKDTHMRLDNITVDVD
jgi:hypothetical protein